MSEGASDTDPFNTSIVLEQNQNQNQIDSASVTKASMHSRLSCKPRHWQLKI